MIGSTILRQRACSAGSNGVIVWPGIAATAARCCAWMLSTTLAKPVETPTPELLSITCFAAAGSAA
jgi:hypothetical protein